MIKKILVKNWKSFKDATLHIDPLTIMIGNNASGKSNALDALLFLNRTSKGIGLYQAINGNNEMSPLRGGIEWVCMKPNKSFTLIVITDGINKQQDLRYELIVEVHRTKVEIIEETLTVLKHRPRSDSPQETIYFNTRLIDQKSPSIQSYFSTGRQGRNKRLDLSRSTTILSQAENLSIRQEVMNSVKVLLNNLRNIFIFDPIPNHMRDYTPMSENLQNDGSNIAGVLAGLEQQKKEDIEKTIADNLKDITESEINRIWSEHVGKFKTDAMLYCEENLGYQETQEIDARGMSDGTLRYISIITALLTRQENSLLVIEEVDNGLHPSRIKNLIHMLRKLGKKRNIDVVITTHNPALLDAVGPIMVPFIVVAHRDSITGNSKLIQLEEIEALPKLMAVGGLGRLSTEGSLDSVLH